MDEAKLQEIETRVGEPPGAFAVYYCVLALVADVRRLRAEVERMRELIEVTP